MSKMGNYVIGQCDAAVTAHCRNCDGEGTKPVAGGTSNEKCTECHGTGEIRCDTGGLNCSFAYCYCEAAWDRQQEDYGRGE